MTSADANTSKTGAKPQPGRATEGRAPSKSTTPNPQEGGVDLGAIRGRAEALWPYANYLDGLIRKRSVTIEPPPLGTLVRTDIPAMADEIERQAREIHDLKVWNESLQAQADDCVEQADAAETALRGMVEAVRALGERDLDRVIYFEAPPTSPGGVERWQALNDAVNTARALSQPSPGGE